MGFAGEERSRAAFVARRMRVWAGRMGCGVAARRRSGFVGREGSSGGEEERWLLAGWFLFWVR